jgi:hypothetical protein
VDFRFEAIRDALEDMELFRMLPTAVATKAVQKLVRSPTDHDDNPVLLERVRRALGRQAHLYADSDPTDLRGSSHKLSKEGNRLNMKTDDEQGLPQKVKFTGLTQTLGQL